VKEVDVEECLFSFLRSSGEGEGEEALMEKLYREIGQLKVKQDFFSQKIRSDMSRKERNPNRAGQCQDQQELSVCPVQAELFVLYSQEGLIHHEGH